MTEPRRCRGSALLARGGGISAALERPADRGPGGQRAPRTGLGGGVLWEAIRPVRAPGRVGHLRDRNHSTAGASPRQLGGLPNRTTQSDF